MFGERRKSQRVSINRTARLQVDTLSRECTIIDISDSGARLFAEEGDIPDQFDLVIFCEKPIRQQCKVIWRLGGEIGVEFATSTDKAHLDAVKRLSDEARRAFSAV